MTTVAETVEFPGSSNISSATYEPDVEDLTIEFSSGDKYVYRNVPPSTYRGLTIAPSAGAFFHRNIRQRFQYEQV